MRSVAYFLYVCSLNMYFCGAAAAPSRAPPPPNAPWAAYAGNRFLVPAMGSLACRGSGMLGWGRHAKLGTSKWLPGEINVLATAF